MWHSATFFSAAAATGLLLAATTVVESTVLITVEEALELAFPGATIERQSLFLTSEQLIAAKQLSGQDEAAALVTRFTATGGDGLLGWAYLDTHRVRTLPETLMVVVAADSSIRRVEVVTFREPLDYLPRESWYRQFDGAKLDDELAVKRRIRQVTGATLTAEATTAAVRRILAIHTVVEGTPR